MKHMPCVLYQDITLKTPLDKAAAIARLLAFHSLYLSVELKPVIDGTPTKSFYQSPTASLSAVGDILFERL